MTQFGLKNISLCIEKYCYNFMKKIFCIIYPEEEDNNYEEIDLENPPSFDEYNPLIKRNVNMKEIIIEDYVHV